MPIGSFSFTPDNPYLTNPATPVLVYKKVSGSLRPAPNVWLEQVDCRTGPNPSVARFSYILGDYAAAFGWPNRFDQLFPINGAPSPYAFVNDDEIVAVALIGSVNPVVLFHGFAQAPQADITGRTQQVSFVALGVEVREWDIPISYYVQRQNWALDNNVTGSGEPGVDMGPGTFVNLHAPCHFNPESNGVQAGNMIPAVAVDEGAGTNGYHPIFADSNLWLYHDDANTDQPLPWTLAGAVQYLLWTYNADQDWVQNPTSQAIDNLLVVKVPNGGFFDPNDSSTYQAQPITIPDHDVTSTVWPESLHALLDRNGFDLFFQTALTGFNLGNLQTNLVIYRRDQAGPYAPKDVYLPAPGLGVDQAYANAAAVHLAWDLNSVRNAVDVEMQRQIYEASFILAPNFKPVDGDDGMPQRARFFTDSVNYQQGFDHKTYRDFVFGDGNTQYWDYNVNGFKRNAARTLSAFYQPNANSDPIYAGPETNCCLDAIRDLVATDKDGNPLSAVLEVWRSQGAAKNQQVGNNQGQVFGRATFWMTPPLVGLGPNQQPGVWEAVDDGAWDLLPGRLGIHFKVRDPENDVKTASGANVPLISGASVGDSDPKAYMFRLTVAFYAPERIPVYNGMRPASPTQFPRWSVIDRQDRIYQENTQFKPTQDLRNVAGTGLPNYKVDDYPRALAEGAAVRSRAEFPPLLGSVTIPSLSLGYQLGDRIRSINGRNISLRANVGDQREAPQYPYVVGITWSFSNNQQTTTLQLSDRRNEYFRAAPTPRQELQGFGGGMMGAAGDGPRLRRDHRRERDLIGAMAGPAAELIPPNWFPRPRGAQPAMPPGGPRPEENRPGFVGPPSFLQGPLAPGQPGQPGVRPNAPPPNRPAPPGRPRPRRPGGPNIPHNLPPGQQWQPGRGPFIPQPGPRGPQVPAPPGGPRPEENRPGFQGPPAFLQPGPRAPGQPGQGGVRPNPPNPNRPTPPGQPRPRRPGGPRIPHNLPPGQQWQPGRGPFQPRPGQGLPATPRPGPGNTPVGQYPMNYPLQQGSLQGLNEARQAMGMDPRQSNRDVINDANMRNQAMGEGRNRQPAISPEEYVDEMRRHAGLKGMQP